jgi:mannose-6-phosphate isomerase-like protein (cupin superfamily)
VTSNFQGPPGAVGVSHLAVYDSTSPDGVPGGSAHVHLSCTESYVVIGGRGRLQTLSYSGFREINLDPLQVVWFTPGVIHRLVNDGDLQIIIVMQNGGLPEAGDCVLSLPAGFLESPTRYREVADLPPPDTGHDHIEAHARQRKDLSVAGFVELRTRVEQEGVQALDDFYRAAAELNQGQLAEWRELWRSGAHAASETTAAQISALETGDLRYLEKAVLQQAQLRAGSPRPGMCGRITNFDVVPGPAGVTHIQ